MKILYIVPTEKGEACDWITNLSEIKLLTQAQAISVPWSRPVTGAAQNWLTIMNTVASHWDEADGFVVWAPDQSLLEMSGLLDLSLQNPGKPVVFFSAPAPDTLTQKKFEKLALKSTLIRATFLAQADLAGVFVLSGENVFYPQSCYWESSPAGFEVASKEQPLATISYQLSQHIRTEKRHQQPLSAQIPRGLSNQVMHLSWMPGMPFVSADEKLPVISLLSAHWDSAEFQQLRQDMQRPVIWSLDQKMSGQDVFEHEAIVEAKQDWWVSLMARYARSLSKSPRESVQTIRRLNA